MGTNILPISPDLCGFQDLSLELWLFATSTMISHLFGSGHALCAHQMKRDDIEWHLVAYLNHQNAL